MNARRKKWRSGTLLRVGENAAGQFAPASKHADRQIQQFQGYQQANTLLIDRKPGGSAPCTYGLFTLVSWSGLDIGLDRGSPVSTYEAPFAFTGELRKVTITMNSDRTLDGDAVGNNKRGAVKTSVIPGCAVRRRPGIHNHHREYGFRARAKMRVPE